MASSDPTNLLMLQLLSTGYNSSAKSHQPSTMTTPLLALIQQQQLELQTQALQAQAELRSQALQAQAQAHFQSQALQAQALLTPRAHVLPPELVSLLQYAQQRPQALAAIAPPQERFLARATLKPILPKIHQAEALAALAASAKQAASVPSLPANKENLLDFMTPTFPVRLHRLIVEAEARGHHDIVHFSEKGDSFWLLDRDRFISELAPKHFRLQSFASFRRQMCLYGFAKRTHDKKLEFRHPLFHRDAPMKLTELLRRDAKP